MIVRPNKTYETHSLFPNTDFYGNEPDNYVVDETTQEGQALADKIMQHAPYMDLVIVDGKLIDVTPTERPPALPPEPTPEQRIATLETENAELRERVADVEPRLGDVEMALADLFTV